MDVTGEEVFAAPELNYVFFFFNGSVANFESADLN